MINTTVLSVIQIVLAVVLVVLILLQNQGTGLGSTFGGSMDFYGTKRGVEKLLFILTGIVAFLFLASSIFALVFG